jgi:hypothetical protein
MDRAFRTFYGLSFGSVQLRLAAPVALALAVVFGSAAMAATPTPYLQDSTIVGSGGTLTATDVPVQTSTGSLVYKDVTIQLNADVKGNLTIAPGYPKLQAAIAPILSNFVAGNYAGPPTIASGKYLVAINGPGLGGGGATAWSLSTAKGAECGTYPGSATWYTGSIAFNPLASRLKKVGIASSFYSYGLVGGNTACGYGGTQQWFEGGTLIGVSQIKGSLTIVSFTSPAGVDSPIPLAEITYTLLP